MPVAWWRRDGRSDARSPVCPFSSEPGPFGSPFSQVLSTFVKEQTLSPQATNGATLESEDGGTKAVWDERGGGTSGKA